jgi:hypothetical protein
LRQSFLNGSLTRLVDPDSILKSKIVEFVTRGDFGLASGKKPDGAYERRECGAHRRRRRLQCAASAASTAGVFFGHGPSSKVSTTSPSRKKSWLLKCLNRYI